jgi:hypothetical protein
LRDGQEEAAPAGRLQVVTSPIIRLIIVVAVVVTITEAIAYPLIQKYRTI